MDKKIISFEAPTELKEALRVAAFNKNLSVSALVREILEKEVLLNSQKGMNNG
jgi:plasmid stability protein